MNDLKLERCPFCGADAEFYEFKRAKTENIGVLTDRCIVHPLPSQYLARCTNKVCNGNTPGTKFFWTKEEAATNWNRRAPLPDNKALTVEELREMDGERVWVQFRGIGMYALVAYHADPDGDDGDDVYLTNNLGGRDTYEQIIGQGGDVYRRPPEKEE